MKPLKLEMQAFGPFADKEVIDFRSLGKNTFFLIHGATGSGKSTILDAMCFALYGETSGETRKGQQMRSDHASGALKTQVTFDFAVGQKTYRVTRSPSQELARLRGEGELVKKQPEGTLWRTDQGRDEVLSSKVSEVTAAIGDLLGFTASQFRQVVVLPQGKFERLLSANSTERQEILAQLFQTGSFREVEDALKKRTSELEGLLKNSKIRKDILLKQIGVQDEDEVATVLETAGQALADLEQVQPEVDQKLAEARAALEAGRQVRDKLAERDKAREGHAEVLARKDLVTTRRVILEAARRASQVEPVRVLHDAHKNALRGRDGELATARQKMVEAGAALDAANGVLAREEARANERDRAVGDVSRLEGMREAVEKLAKARGALDEAAQTLAQSEGTVEVATRAFADAETKAKELQLQVDAATEAATRIDGLQARHEQATRTAKDRKTLGDLVAKHAQAVSQLEALSARKNDLDQQLRAASDALQQAEAQWRSGQAAVLAKGLEDGKPCPVCGAIDHPRPAVATAGKVPTDPMLATLREARDRVQGEIQQTSAKEAGLREQHAALQTQIRDLREQLASQADASIEHLQTQQTEAARALEEARKMAGAGEGLRKALASAEATVLQLRGKQHEAEAARQQAATALENARTLVDERSAQIPDSLRGAGALDEALCRARDHRDALHKALDNAREGRNKAAEVHAGAVASLETATTARKNADDTLSQTREKLLEALAQAGFPDEAALIAAQRTPTEVQVLQDELAQYDKDLATASDRMQRAEAVARDLVAPDLEVLEARDKEAAVQKTEHDQRVGSLRTQVTTLKQQVTELGRLRDADREVERDYGIVGHLSKIASGDNPQCLTFERYVLAALLDEVLVEATRRLMIMSQGRYQLSRARTVEDRRSHAGLDLEVLDSHTGHARSVNTLSGGEGFMAALSLALGLADVVQSRAGGIRLDAIFVDEGFGSLDPEAMDSAIRTLQELKDSGRLVGIISHVPALREAIDVRLEVIGGHGGSTTRFIMPG